MSSAAENKKDQLQQLTKELHHQLQKAEEAGERQRKHEARARELSSQIQSMLSADTSAKEIREDVEYMVIQNGTSKPALESEVQRLRDEWNGEFLLDLPARVLHINTENMKEDVSLGRGGLGKCAEKVLVKGMSKPGRPFGQTSFDAGKEPDPDPWARSTLASVVCRIRKAMGDRDRDTSYLQTVEVGRGLSGSGYGYQFTPHADYLVIRRKKQ